MSKLFSPFITVFVVGIFGIWKAIPVGLILKVSPFYIFLMTSLGATGGVVFLYFFGRKIKSIFPKRKKKENSKKNKRAAKIFQKYGTAGLGFFGCGIIGPNLTMIIGLVLSKKEKQLLLWALVGCVVWSFVLTLIAYFSVELFYKLTDLI